MKLNRGSGILVHITSLPSPFGIGDLGPGSYGFVDFLVASGHKFWQLLPLNPTDGAHAHSPYSGQSAFAGNPLLISPQLLEDQGLVNLADFPFEQTDPHQVDFGKVKTYKDQLLDSAYSEFKNKKEFKKDFKKFCKKHDFWLDDFSLYKALAHKYKKSWVEWPEPLRDREKKAMKEAKKELADEILKAKFIQFIFFSQWQRLSEYVHEKGIQFIGDIPFYVNHESSDCWAYARYFKLDEDKKQKYGSGVPPDAFSKTGQLWNTPVFDWDELKKDDYKWWVERLEQNVLLFDMVRLDHFRAFSAYWEVPSGEKTAENGKWVKAPGKNFFKLVKKKFPKMPFIAEDLGEIDKPVEKLLQKFSFPGMKVLQFAFGDDKKNNLYLPFNHVPHSIVYTGTHDNPTIKSWFKDADQKTKRHLQEYTDRRLSKNNVYAVMHRMALNSVSQIAVVPLQDFIALGEEGLMNIPGTSEGNWMWRITPEEMPLNQVEKFKKLNVFYGRFVEPKTLLKKKKKEKSEEKLRKES